MPRSSYDLRDLESEVRRLADAIGNLVRQIQTERREHALDTAAARVTQERIAAAQERRCDLLTELAEANERRHREALEAYKLAEESAK